MIPIITFIFFLLGLIIGSFLNVVILRLNTKKSFGGRSACMACKNTLAWFELIPLFSYVGLSGRCRNCKTKISIQYPLVELTVGIIFAALFLKFQDIFFLSAYAFAAMYAYYTLFFSLLLVAAVYDLKYKIIPDSLSITLGIISFVGLFLFNSSSILLPYWHMPSLLQFLAGPIIAAPFALLWLVSRGRWMGLGDAKLATSLGWVAGLYTAISGVVIAFWAGAIVGVFLLMFSGKYKMKSEIPFAPYLAFGVFLAFLLELHIF
ncbi:prepilin peptidase [Candidatus Nomurabacteria bacterium]|nr:prepilin peptidase [Candidatus Nomurabacteria bacterium]